MGSEEEKDAAAWEAEKRKSDATWEETKAAANDQATQDKAKLERWQNAVDDFAGLKPPGKETLWQELQRSQLSKRHVEPTADLVPTVGSADPIALCEMRLSMPMTIDVTIDVPNLQTVDISAGGVFVTWGSIKGVVQVAEIDIGRGWRHPFYASYLRVDFVAVRDGIPLNGNQPDNMQLTASLSPATGAPVMPLTCTRFFRNLLPGGDVDTKDIPSYAKTVRLCGSTGGNFPFIAPQVLFSMGNPTGVSIFRQLINGSGALPENAPGYLMNAQTWPIPQRASNYRVQNFDSTALSNLTAIAELQL